MKNLSKARVMLAGSLAIAAGACATMGEMLDAPSTSNSSLPISGCWQFKDQAGDMYVNRITKLDDNQMTVVATGRSNATNLYRRINQNTYREVNNGGDATYQFLSPTSAIWNSNDNRAITFQFWRVDRAC